MRSSGLEVLFCGWLCRGGWGVGVVGGLPFLWLIWRVLCVGIVFEVVV